jgi:trans-2,3-dihydro-3-hydroxyanthranilate isomerase
LQNLFSASRRAKRTIISPHDFFFEADGLREDPATGAANVCFGALLEAQGYGAGQGLSIVVEQGFEMGRPSLVHVRVTNPLPGQIVVGGGVRPVARGTIL